MVCKVIGVSWVKTLKIIINIQVEIAQNLGLIPQDSEASLLRKIILTLFELQSIESSNLVLI